MREVFVLEKKTGWASAFVVAFVLNVGWEFAHSPLYTSYQGQAITAFVLFRAALVDALIILALMALAQTVAKYRALFMVIGGLVFAVGIELWAMQTGRWAYDALMPIIPWLNIGLTPLIQLAITGYIAQKFLKP